MWKHFWFWKLTLSLAASGLMLLIITVPPGTIIQVAEVAKLVPASAEVSTCETNVTQLSEPQLGLKAATYALIAATFLFFMLIPKDSDHIAPRLVDAFTKLAAASAAWGAALAWVWSEIPGMATIYLYGLGLLAGGTFIVLTGYMYFILNGFALLIELLKLLFRRGNGG